jgi:hypothetical protein
MKNLKLLMVWIVLTSYFLMAGPVLAEKSMLTGKLNYRDYLVKKVVIHNMLEKHNSPMLGESDSFIKACMTYDLNCYLLPSISGLESSFGKAMINETHNPFGWGGGTIYFKSWEEAYMSVARGLKNNYLEKGALTINQIAPIYAASPTWAQRVSFFLSKFEEEELVVRQNWLL